MIKEGLVVVTLIITYFIYKWIISPKRQIAHYTKMFKLQNYNVAELPFKPHLTPFYDDLGKQSQANHDPYYEHKRRLVHTDIIITNALVRPNIVLMNANMIKEMMTSEKMMVLHKEKDLNQVLFSTITNGIIGLEGDDWKNRKKMLSKVFNHDFITGHIPMMINIADKVFDEVEAEWRQSNPEENGQFKVNLFDLLVMYNSQVVMSGFLGVDSLKEQLKGDPIVKATLKMTDMAFDSQSDPLILIFGGKLLNRCWRKKDKMLYDLRN